MSKKRTKKARRSTIRRSQIETLEARQVMTADPLSGLLGGSISHHAIDDGAGDLVQHALGGGDLMQHGDLVQHGGYDASVADPNADFWLEGTPEQMLEELADGIEQTLASAHELTGMDQVKTNYGFSGVGQTVAVIDSGIAYNHYALGGGLGSNYRVVGGYDFTENDSDPYDDGTEGSHGTHVAGIVGADDGSRSGVAPGVDLVGLRVFADNGAGYFSWVESALQWVHANRNAFENPITAVNLSLGTTWNSTSIPGWATLEDEFAQLKADGIFISVSAGNSYTSYNTPGLSYPAASPYVVPVMSSDDSGMLSYFSQRHQSAISAPGRYVYSTVPDYAGNNNGVDDDWANFSGTSMAAPYVAGASVIIREAMEFVGMTGIDQDDIFDLMMDTADSFYDSSTGLYYNRLNMQSAIDAIMPVDDFGNSVADAYNLGTITDGPSSQSGPMSGHIATIGDSDYFTFTAGATGTVTFAAQNTTHYMDASWDAMGADGQASEDGSSYTLNVVAGQQYSIALSSSDGLGYYDLLVTAESTFSYVDWGATGVQETKTGVNIAGDVYFRVVAGYDGYLTAEAVQTAGISGLQFVDSGLATVGSTASGRADYYATAGEELYLKVTGTATGVDFRLTNAVSVSGGVVTVVGTSGDDAVEFEAGASSHEITLNGTAYTFDSATYDSFNLDGGGGADYLVGAGSAAVDTASMSSTGAVLESADYSFESANFYYSTFIGSAEDVLFLIDSGINEIFIGRESSSILRGAANEYINRGNGFGVTNAYGHNGGFDRAVLYDTVQDDILTQRWNQSVLRNSASTLRISAKDFDRVTANSSNGGYDKVFTYDTSGDDLFIADSTTAAMRDASYSYWNIANGFDRVSGQSTSGGSDAATLIGYTGDGTSTSGSLSELLAANSSYYILANNFASVDIDIQATPMQDAGTESFAMGAAVASEAAATSAVVADYPAASMLRTASVGGGHSFVSSAVRSEAFAGDSAGEWELVDATPVSRSELSAALAIISGEEQETSEYEPADPEWNAFDEALTLLESRVG